MPNEFWGAAGNPGLTRPAGAPALVLFLAAATLLTWLFVRLRAAPTLRNMSRPQWLLFLALAVASFLLSQLFPLQIPWTNPLLSDFPATGVAVLLAAAPYLIAGAALNVPAAMLVGLVAGVGRAVWQTGAPVDIVAVALAAGASAVMLRQNYAGRLFGAARRPVVAGVAGRLILPLFTGLAVFAGALAGAGFYGAFDLALYVGVWSIPVAVAEGLVSGGVASAVLWIVPQWRPARGLVPSPLQRSLQRQLVAAFLAFAVVVVLLSATVAFYFSARATERALAEQMVDRVDATAARLSVLQSDLTAALAQYGTAGGSPTPLARQELLGRVQANPLFEDVRLVDETGVTLAGRAAESEPASLSAGERALVDAALAVGRAQWGAANAAGAPQVLVAVPTGTAEGETVTLLAVVSPATTAAILNDLSVAGEQGGGLLVDEDARVILDTGDLAGSGWNPPTPGGLSRRLSASTGRDIYMERDAATGRRQLLTYSSIPGSGWKVVTIVPHAAVLRRTLGIIGPLALLLLAVSGVFCALVASLGRDITRPIAEMGRASKAIAGGGGLERPVRPQREDEIGQLSLAFSQMQRALRQRLDELSLLLSVSNEVSATIHIDEGMSAVLQGVLRGTGAAAARAIVRNPNAPAPLIFAEGPAADSFGYLDRPVLLRLRAVDELICGSAGEIEAGLEVEPGAAAALFALPLRPGGDFQGALYLAYRQPHYFDHDERNLLRTLAGQATVLVQNAHLFSAAEGGRRRLAAILASTTNGVIVTDQTDRVLLINPAAERAFGLRATAVVGRPVVDVLAAAEPSGTLARRLSLGLSAAVGGAADGKVELEAGGRDFLAGIATVYSHEGQTMGRVAVLQDVSDMKELERMKSDFIAGISHDLLSPLTYMHNYAAMLPVIDDPNLEREYTDKILGGIDRMKQLVNDLLELARIEAGLHLQFDRVQVGDLLAEVTQEYASPARARGVRLEVECAPDLTPIVADPLLLRRAVTNLVTNGLKYAPDSGPLTLRAETNDAEVVISVRDRGPGIAPADQAHLFEKFYRGHPSPDGRTPGSGLGLAIVKSVADHHGGRVWCESALGEGSAFFLALPKHRDKTTIPAHSSM